MEEGGGPRKVFAAIDKFVRIDRKFNVMDLGVKSIERQNTNAYIRTYNVTHHTLSSH